MKLLQKRFPLFISLLLFFSTTKADNPSSQSRFEFLTHSLENATSVENGLTLAKNIGEVSLSTVINTGIWWTVCKAPGFISEMASRHSLTDTEKQELVSIKSDFCLQLAPLIATTETVLAGQVSPWPIAPLWWRSVFLMGAGLATYGSIAYPKMQSIPQNIATVVLAYLTIDGVSRTLGGAVSTAILKKIETTHIDDNAYHEVQYSALAGVTGLITGSIIYGMLLHKSIGSARACFISAISAIVASTSSQIISIHNAGFNLRDNVIRITVAGTITAIITGAVAAAGAGAVATAGTWAGVIAGTVAGAGAGAGAVTLADSGVILGALAGVAGGAVSGDLLIAGINKLAPNNPPLKIAGAVALATSYALINSLIGFAVYGYPLEQSLSKTTQTLWNKFLAPLDYLATLFPQLLSEHELEETSSY